ncbi:hypothetical protein DSBG_1392 [Desulfosporosinus sp. BG]|nr:hypothetical protein DSBG_1392 [Desulfosporosinus sp. BG]
MIGENFIQVDQDKCVRCRHGKRIDIRLRYAKSYFWNRYYTNDGEVKK